MASVAIPIVDWRKLHTDRAGFLADIKHALGDIGFLCLTNAPRFEPEVHAVTIGCCRRVIQMPF
jgi:hypothetical protein